MPNSKITRVRPVFSWLAEHDGQGWAEALVKLSRGANSLEECGSFSRMHLDPEMGVPATQDRLRWMLRNLDQLAPKDGRRWDELRQRFEDREDQIQAALAGTNLIPRFSNGLPTQIA
jgi:hypothetical protein